MKTCFRPNRPNALDVAARQAVFDVLHGKSKTYIAPDEATAKQFFELVKQQLEHIIREKEVEK